MVWRQGLGGVVLALALAGCSSFVEADAGSGEEDDGGGSSGDTTDPTVGVSTSGATDSGGPGTTPVTTNSDTSGTDPTNPSTSGTSESVTDSDTTGPPTSSTMGETTQSTSGTGGETGEQTGEETTGPGECLQADEEPSDSFADRQLLGEQACQDAASSFTGTLLDEADVDRLQFTSDWSFIDCGGGVPDHVYVPNGPIELCASAACPNDGMLACDGGAFVMFGSAAYCCSTNPFRLLITCDGLDQATTGFPIVRADPKSLECAEYSFTYAVEFVG